jgi:hypothetical protein
MNLAPDKPQPQPSVVPAALTPEQRRNLADPAIQEQYRREYSIQQARRSCPGCGESSLSF